MRWPVRPARRLTVRRAPRLEPPYDDELPDGPRRLIRQREELPFEEAPPGMLGLEKHITWLLSQGTGTAHGLP